MIKDKDELKKKIYQLFTKIRTALNEREDEICKIIDNKFDSLYFKEDFINQGNKLPNEIKQSLEKGKSLNNENNDLNKFINNCIIIENNIKKIQIIKENIEECNTKVIEINFFPKKEDEINEFIDKIKSFGEIKEEILYKKQKKILKKKKKGKKENKWKEFKGEINFDYNTDEEKKEGKKEEKNENIFEEDEDEDDSFDFKIK